MAAPITVNQSTTLVQVDTSVLQPDGYVVRLSSVNTPGALITIRDITGNASANNQIFVSTMQDIRFLDGGGVNSNLYRINQPYGFLTITPKTSTLWGVTNTFAFPDVSAAANINNLTASSITINNSYLNRAIISTAYISTLSTDNVFIRANISIGQSTIGHAGHFVCSVRSLEDIIAGGTFYGGSTVSTTFGNITSTLTVPFISTNSIEIYGLLRSASTISTLGPLFVGSSISTTGNLAVGGSTFIQGELRVLQNAIFNSSLSTIFSLGVGRETQLYSSLTVRHDILANTHISTLSNVNVGGALSVMKTAFFTDHVSTQSNVTVGGALSVMSTFYTFGNSVLNSSLNVVGAVSTLSNVYIASTLSVGRDLVVFGNVNFNNGLNLQNISVLQDLFVNNTISTYSSIVAGQFLRVMGSTFLIGPVSTLSNVDVGGAISTMGNLTVLGDTYLRSNVVIQSSLSTIGNLNVFGFLSTLSSVNIAHNLQVQSNVFVGSSLSTVGSAAFHSSVQIRGGLSVFSSVAIQFDLDVGRNLNARNLVMNGSTIISTLAVTNTVGFGLNLSTSTLHFGLFSTLGAMDIGGKISTTNSLIVGSTIDSQFVTVRSNSSTLGNVGVGSNIFALRNIFSGESTIVGGGFYGTNQAFFNNSLYSRSLTIESGSELSGTTRMFGETFTEDRLTAKSGIFVYDATNEGVQNRISNDTYMSSLKTSSITVYNFQSTIGQMAIFSSLQVQGGLSVFSSLGVACNADVGALLTASSIITRSLRLSTLDILQQSNFVLYVSSSTLHAGLFSTSGEIFSGRLISTTSSLAVGDNVNFYRNLTIGGNTVTGGIFQAGGAATLSNILQVAQAATLSNTLNVGGVTTLSDTLRVENATSLSNTLGVRLATTLSNTLAVGLATTLSNTLQVVGDATLQSGLIVPFIFNSSIRTSSILTSTLTASNVSTSIANISSLIVGTTIRYILTATLGGVILRTSDYGSSYTTATQTILTTINSIKTNGNVSVAVGAASSGKPIVYSYDGLTWTRATGGVDTAVNDLIWTGSQFVAVGTVFQTSTDGVTWATVTLPTTPNTPPATITAVGWNGSYYVLTSSTRIYNYNPSTATITEVNSSFTAIYKVIWTGSFWLIGGDGAYDIASFNGTTLTQLGYTNSPVNSIASNGKTVVAVGNGILAYSSDGIIWSSGSNPFSPATSINDVIWDGANFVAFFTGGSKLARSSDGITWTPAATVTTNQLYRGTAYMYTTALKQNLGGLLTADSISTTGFVTVGDFLRVGQSTLVVQDSTRTVGINCNSPSYPVDVNGIINAKFIYQNGEPYQPPPTTGDITIINLKASTITAAFSATIKNTTVQPKFIISGQIPSGATTVYKLYVGASLTSMTDITITGSPIALNYTFYTGSTWYLGGKRTTTASGLYSSTDAVSWTLISPSGEFPNSFVNYIVSNGNYSLICGADTTVNTTTRSSRSIVKTTNFTSFTASSTTAGSLSFRAQCLAAAWNGTLWVAVGQDTDSSTYIGPTIKYSYDGTNWSPAMNAFGANTSSTSSIGYSVVWNGYLFVAGADDSTCSLKYSYNGIVWYNCRGSFGLTSLTKVISWSGKRFVAIQAVYASGNHILYSDDGITWSRSGQTVSNPYSLVWTGTQFVVGTSKSAVLPKTFVSENGIYWTEVTPSVAYNTELIMNSMTYSFNTVPDLTLGNTTFYANQQPQTLGAASSINTVLLMSNALLLNDLYTDTSGKVGVNCNSPQVALDVNGFAKINNTMTPTVWICIGVQSSVDGIYVSIDNGSTWILAYTYSDLAANLRPICWDGKRWLAILSNLTVITSTTGFNWSVVPNVSGLTGITLIKLIWTGTYYIGISLEGAIVRSLDGITWTSANVFATAGTDIVYNGRILVAVGTGTIATAIKYSTDHGSTWLNATGAITNSAVCVATNGKIWLVGYSGGILYSLNGLSYAQATSFTLPYSIAWNGTVFVAVGQDTTANIKYSYDGITWTNSRLDLGSSYFTQGGSAVAWNGSLFIAVGRSPSNSEYKSSTDGITWRNMAVSGSPSLYVNVIRFSSNVDPDLQVENLTLYGKNQYPLLTSTNTIHLSPSTIVLNNTLSVGADGNVDINGEIDMGVAKTNITSGSIPSNLAITFAGSVLLDASGNYVFGSTNGTGSAARFQNIHGVTTGLDGTIYVFEHLPTNARIRKITQAGVVTTLTSGVNAFPLSGVVDSDGNVYCVTEGIIQKVTSAGVITTVAGSITGGYVNATGVAARFRSRNIAIGIDGNLYVTNDTNRCIRKIIPSTGVVTTFAGALPDASGNGTAGFIDGVGTAARFIEPHGIISGKDGHLYVADSTSIRKITLDGVVTTIAGSSFGGYDDGIGIAARFTNAMGISMDTLGNIYVTEKYLRKITPEGVVTTIFTVKFDRVYFIDIDIYGNLFYAEFDEHVVKKIPAAMFYDNSMSITKLIGNTISNSNIFITESSVSKNDLSRQNIRMLVAVGGNDNASRQRTIQYSTDSGLSWKNRMTGGFYYQGFQVVYSGSIWVAIGQDNRNDGHIQWSTDGINWNYPTLIESAFFGTALGYNGSRWLASFRSVDNTTSFLQFSSDGKNWTRTAAIPTNQNETRAFAWSSSLGLWVAAGNLSSGTSSLQTLQWSADGITWNNALSDAFVNPPISGANSQGGYGVTWNGSYFIATGAGSSAANTILRSIDGKNWTNCTSGGFGIQGFSAAWSPELSLWVAVGYNSLTTGVYTGMVKTSTDGLVWTNTSTTWTGSSAGNMSVKWTGTSFILGRFNNSAPMLISRNGIQWYATTNNFILNCVDAVAGFGSETINTLALEGNTRLLGNVAIGSSNVERPGSVVTAWSGYGTSLDLTLNGDVNTSRYDDILTVDSDLKGRLYVYTKKNSTTRQIRRITNGTSSLLFEITCGSGNHVPLHVARTYTIFYGISAATSPFNTTIIERRISTDAGSSYGTASQIITGRTNVTAILQSYNNLGLLYYVDNYAICMFESATTTILAGSILVTGNEDSSIGIQARFGKITAICIDSTETYMYILDSGNSTIRRMTLIAPYEVITYAGSSEGYADGFRLNAKFSFPLGLVCDANNNLYVGDNNNHRVRFIDTTTGIVYTAAGRGTSGRDSGVGERATFWFPRGITVTPDGYIYVGTANGSAENKIAQLTPFYPNVMSVNGTVSINSVPDSTFALNVGGNVNMNGRLRINDGIQFLSRITLNDNINDSPSYGIGIADTDNILLGGNTGLDNNSLQIASYFGINFIGGITGWATNASHMAITNGRVGIQNKNPLHTLDVNGNIRMTGTTMYIGSTDSGNLSNFIRFSGTFNDFGGNHTVIAERRWAGLEDSELVLFKGNDVTDRVRVLTTGGFQVDIAPLGTWDDSSAIPTPSRPALLNVIPQGAVVIPGGYDENYVRNIIGTGANQTMTPRLQVGQLAIGPYYTGSPEQTVIRSEGLLRIESGANEVIIQRTLIRENRIKSSYGQLQIDGENSTVFIPSGYTSANNIGILGTGAGQAMTANLRVGDICLGTGFAGGQAGIIFGVSGLMIQSSNGIVSIPRNELEVGNMIKTPSLKSTGYGNAFDPANMHQVQGNVQGLYTSWNYSGGNGEGNFINVHSTGGFNWMKVVGWSGTSISQPGLVSIMSLTQAGVLSVVSVTQTSDIRLKENIVTIDSPLDKIMMMRGVYYTRKEYPECRNIGVIAQEIEKVLPEVVFTDTEKEKYKSVSYGNIVAILIEGIKAQQVIIDSQAAEIASLKATVAAILQKYPV